VEGPDAFGAAPEEPPSPLILAATSREPRRPLRGINFESLNRLKNVLRHPPLCFPPKHDGHSAKYQEDKHAGPHRNDRRAYNKLPASENPQEVAERRAKRTTDMAVIGFI